jgi:hypothetical protein
MSTSAARQRKRRARLKAEGIVDVTVPVPLDQADTLRTFARRLRGNIEPPVQGARLFKSLQVLKSFRNDMVHSGVRHAGVFGSVARGEDVSDSDIDILISIDSEQVVDVLSYIKITDRIEQELQKAIGPVSVDVANREAMKPRTKARAIEDVIYAY